VNDVNDHADQWDRSHDDADQWERSRDHRQLATQSRIRDHSIELFGFVFRGLSPFFTEGRKTAVLAKIFRKVLKWRLTIPQLGVIWEIKRMWFITETLTV